MNSEEWKITTEAIHNAVDSFYKTIEDAGFDGAYWNIFIEADIISSDFEHILERISYDNQEEYIGKEVEK